MRKFLPLVSLAFAISLASSWNLAPPNLGNSDRGGILEQSIAEARKKKSGGRSRSGSFSSPSRSGSSGRSSSPSRTQPSNTRSGPSPTTRSSPSPVQSSPSPTPTSTTSPAPQASPTTSPTTTVPQGSASPRTSPTTSPQSGGNVIVPVPVQQNNRHLGTTTTYTSSNNFLPSLILLVLGAIALIVLLVFWQGYRNKQSQTVGRVGAAGGAGAAMPRDLRNDIVTVTKIQIALLASAREIQAQLTQLSAEADLASPEGMYEFLQEAVLALLRSPEYWSHVLAFSQTVQNRQAARRLFEQISIAERSKYDTETFSNIEGRIRQRSNDLDPEAVDPAAYIVVTLLVGTEDDKPLLEETLRSEDDLKAALNKIAGIPPDYLTIFELLWIPQDEADSLTYDDLISHYTEMVRL